MRYSNDIKDEEGYPAFALVNKATGQAIKHSLGQSHPVSTQSPSDLSSAPIRADPQLIHR